MGGDDGMDLEQTATACEARFADSPNCCFAGSEAQKMTRGALSALVAAQRSGGLPLALSQPSVLHASFFFSDGDIPGASVLPRVFS